MDFLGGENLWLYLPLLAWIGVLVYLSSGVNSISQTANFFVPLLGSLFPRVGEGKLRTYHVIIRKIGHVAGYAILALLASVAFYNSAEIAWAAEYWHVCAFSVVLVVASADEARQYFEPARDGSVRDVALDCVGGLAMIFLFWIDEYK
jgi:VanZ family protein